MCDISQLRGYPLDNRYVLVRQEVGKDGRFALVLGKVGKGNTFLDDLSEDPKTRSVARNVVTYIDRVIKGGTRWAIATRTLKHVDSGPSKNDTWELRAVSRSNDRVMTYIHDDERQTPVFLFYFVGHSSRGGKISKEDKKRGLELALIARKLMLAEEGRSDD